MSNKYLSTSLFALFVAIMIIAPLGQVLAQGTAIENPIKSEELEDILQAITKVLMAAAVPVFVVMVAIGSYYIVTGANSPKNREKARKIFFYSFLGFLIIMFSFGIIQLVKVIY